MFEKISIRHFHPGLNIGVQDVRNMWLLCNTPVKPVVGLHRGTLVFRIPGSTKRISYQALKKGLIKRI